MFDTLLFFERKNSGSVKQEKLDLGEGGGNIAKRIKERSKKKREVTCSMHLNKALHFLSLSLSDLRADIRQIKRVSHLLLRILRISSRHQMTPVKSTPLIVDQPWRERKESLIENNIAGEQKE